MEKSLAWFVTTLVSRPVMAMACRPYSAASVLERAITGVTASAEAAKRRGDLAVYEARRVPAGRPDPGEGSADDQRWGAPGPGAHAAES